jgi:hypothetical protein
MHCACARTHTHTHTHHIYKYIHILSRAGGLCVTYKTDFELDIGFIAPYTCNYSAIAVLQTLQFTVPHTLSFSVLTSHILATDLYQSVTSNHTWIICTNSFLAIILQLPIPKTRLNSIPLLPRSYPGKLASRNSILHNCCSIELFFITTLHGPHGKHRLLLSLLF